MLINGIEVTRGLMVKSPWIEKILQGSKTWELRSYNTQIRGTIGLIKSKSSLIYGLCDIVKVLGPLSYQELIDNSGRHGIPEDEIYDLIYNVLKYRTVYAWVIESVSQLKLPTRYTHPSGAVIWVRL